MRTPAILFRTDASSRIGGGHVFRCLAVADALARLGYRCVFLSSRAMPGSLIEMVAEHGHEQHFIETHVDGACEAAMHEQVMEDAMRSASIIEQLQCDVRLVIDHYGLDHRFETALRDSVEMIAVIDDLADRRHDCDVLLDPGFPDRERAYGELVGECARLLVGPHYALLRDEFHVASMTGPERTLDDPRRLLVFMGYSDPERLTETVLDALDLMDLAHATVVVVGGGNPRARAIVDRCSLRPDTQAVVDTPAMAGLLSRCDLAIGAAGSSSWERCLLGVPSALVTFADNQVPVAEGLAGIGAAVYLGDRPDAPTIANACKALLLDDFRLRSTAAHARNVVRGARPAFVHDFVFELSGESPGGRLRAMREGDADRIFHWRNSDRVRRWMRSADRIPRAVHESWMEATLSDASSWYLVYEWQERPVGLVYFTEIDPATQTCRWGFYRGEPVTAELPPGLGASMCRQAIAHVLSSGWFARVTAEVMRENVASLRLHENLGFRVLADATPSDSMVRLELRRQDWDGLHGAGG